MQVIGIDLGGTKVVAAHFSENGEMTGTRSALLEGRTGTHVAALIADLCSALLEDLNLDMQEEKCIGICVPGIANSKTNRIWAPNIPGWENFSLKDFLAEAIPNTRVLVESDRTCYILGEVWKGVAQGCHNAIYLSVGTGIGAGILIDDRVLHGNADVVGAIGWMGSILLFLKNIRFAVVLKRMLPGPALPPRLANCRDSRESIKIPNLFLRLMNAEIRWH